MERLGRALPELAIAYCRARKPPAACSLTSGGADRGRGRGLRAGHFPADWPVSHVTKWSARGGSELTISPLSFGRSGRLGVSVAWGTRKLAGSWSGVDRWARTAARPLGRHRHGDGSDPDDGCVERHG